MSANVTILGTGMMGGGFAHAMLARGEVVTVWNRTAERTRPLEKLGARVAADPKEAVAGAGRVHIMLADDASVDETLRKIAPYVVSGAHVIDHTTVTPRGTAERFAWCDARGIDFVHAPVFMSPQACRDATGVMLVSAPEARFRTVRDALEKMTGDLWYLGERPDKAASLKLCGNMLLFFVVAGLADAYALAKSAGVSAREAHQLFSHFNLATAIKMRGGMMASGDFTSAFDLAMARKDLRLMQETAAEANVPLTILPAIGRQMDEFIARGFGGADLGVLAADVVEPSTVVSRACGDARGG